MINENQIQGMGFKLDKQYDLQYEFTYEDDQLISSDLTIDEINAKEITIEELKAITPVLGKRKPCKHV